VYDWKVESLRLTLFRTKPIETVIPLWQNFAGEKPEKVDFRPRDNVIVEEGTIVLGSLVHMSDPLRINWTLSPSEEQQKKTTSFPFLGPLSEVKGQFLNIMIDWLKSGTIPDTNRLALGLVSMIVNENRESAYKKLSELLPYLKIDIENSTDFLYQINRPIKSTVENELLINRLSKWNAVRFMGIGFLLDDKPEVINTSKDFVATRLELDINTHQSNKRIFSKENSILLLRELSEIGDQISAEGDK
jgi:hypothetical protein